MATGTPIRNVGFSVLWRKIRIAKYAPKAPPTQVIVNNVRSEIRQAPTRDRRLSTKNDTKASKLVTMYTVVIVPKTKTSLFLSSLYLKMALQSRSNRLKQFSETSHPRELFCK